MDEMKWREFFRLADTPNNFTVYHHYPTNQLRLIEVREDAGPVMRCLTRDACDKIEKLVSMTARNAETLGRIKRDTARGIIDQLPIMELVSDPMPKRHKQDYQVFHGSTT